MSPDEDELSRGGKGGEKERAPSSQWCKFFAGQNPLPPEVETIMVGTSVLPLFRSRYYGRLGVPGGHETQRSKVVLPWNRLVEQALDLLAAFGSSPWYLPCKLEERETVMAAYAVDYQMLAELNPASLDPHQLLQVYMLHLHALGQELTTLKQEQADLREEVNRYRRGQEFLLAAQRRVLITVDYQNFQKTARAGEWQIPLVQLNLTAAIESVLRWFKADWPRKVAQVMVFDYRKSHHEEFYERLRANGYEFVEVPDIEGVDGTKTNLTDQIICSHVLRVLREPGHGIQDFFLVSGDGDYIPLLKELRQRGLKVYAAGFSGHISADLELHTDGVAILDQLVPVPPPEYWQDLLTPAPPPSGPPAPTEPEPLAPQSS